MNRTLFSLCLHSYVDVETTIGGDLDVDLALALTTVRVLHYHATSKEDVVYNKLAVRLMAKHSESSSKSAPFFLAPPS